MTARHHPAEGKPPMSTVIIVDTMDKSYHSHRVFASSAEARAFADGMEAAWKISHGYYNCWRPFVLDDADQRKEWENMGSPGKDRIAP